jgi:hypothetical protein
VNARPMTAPTAARSRARAPRCSSRREIAPHALGHDQRGGVRCVPAGHGQQRLHHDEGIALAHRPDVSAEPFEVLRLAAGADQGVHESQSLGMRQRGQTEPRELLLLLELVERPVQRGYLGQLLLARGQSHQDRLRRETAPDERKQAQAHVVGPVHVLEQQHEWRCRRRGLQQSHDALEQPMSIGASHGSYRMGHLGKEPRQLHAPDRLDAS